MAVFFGRIANVIVARTTLIAPGALPRELRRVGKVAVFARWNSTDSGCSMCLKC